MDKKRYLLNIILLALTLNVFAQYSVFNKFELPSEVNETSGLIFFNNRLITHNDSGNNPELFEIDTITGSIVRIVSVSNATNVDWEDLAQDDEFLYVADIGNNNGTRTDLKVYRINKNDYENNTTVTADIIEYSYADQSDFTSHPNETNWDAEAIVVWDDNLLIFSKNWDNNEVDLYVIPKVPGTYTAVSESNYNVLGMVTGADRISDDIIVLTGYDGMLNPFVVVMNQVESSLDFDFFNNCSIAKYVGIASFGNQVEAISYISTSDTFYHLFISNEKFTQSFLTVDPKLRSFDLDRTDLGFAFIETKEFIISPNPSRGLLTVEMADFKNEFSKKQVFVYNSVGILVRTYNEKRPMFEVNLETLGKGIYFMIIKQSGKSFAERIIIQ